MRRVIRGLRTLVATATVLGGAAPAAHAADALRLSAHGRTVIVEQAPWRLKVLDAGGRVLAAESAATAVESIPNADRAPFAGLAGGIDVAYPGLPTVSYQPLAFRRAGAWQHVTAALGSTVAGDGAELTVATSDGGTGRVAVAIEPDGAVHVTFRPTGDPARGTVEAVAESFDAPIGERYVGGGQRFGSFDQRGRSVPLWISHGQGSDRFGSTNEIAVPFLLSTGGWALGLDSAARGELNVGVPSERADALGAVLEDDTLTYRIYTGTPAQMLAAYTERAGRPSPPPPEWAYAPAYWMDEGNTQATIEAYADRLAKEGLSAGAFWIDNPWEAHKGDFAPDPKRFGDFDAMTARLKARGLHTVAWASPYVDPDSTLGPAVTAGRHLVEGTGANDATYQPPRGLDPHLDMTDATGVDLYERAAAALVGRGVDGFKADRGEEDLGEGSRWSDGGPNRANHNPYPGRYQAALREGCRRAGKPDCFIIGRGGAAGAQRDAAAWAGDNVSAPGPAGLDQALRSLLSLSVSGQPISGSDIGGYVGTRETLGEGFPTKSLYLRWTQLGALSPIMQTPTAPWAFDAEALAIFRRYAGFHAVLAPSLARWGREAAETGMPIVRPLLLAFPGDPAAAGVADEYLLGPDLLVAPVTETGGDTETRDVYFPAGRWRDAFDGTEVEGPRTLPVTVPLDRMPLYARVGGQVPEEAFGVLTGRMAPPAPGAPPPAGGGPCRDRLAPRTRLLAPGRSGGRLRLRGRASDRGCRATGVARVLVAVQRSSGGRCAPVGRAGTLGRRVSCRRWRFLPARGRTRWSRRIVRRLPPGRYRVRARAVDRAGNAEGRGVTRTLRLP